MAKKLKNGFTLVELLVVVGIIGILLAVLVPSIHGAISSAKVAKCEELIKETQTVLTHIFDENGVWPKCLIANNNTVAGLDAVAAYPLAVNGMSLTSNSDSAKLAGNDRFGILTPWAQDVVKNMGTGCSESTAVPEVGGTIADHRLRYAIDLDGDGRILDVNVASTVEGAKGPTGNVSIRATAAVWCRGPKGKVVMSWTDGDTKGVD